MPYDNFLSLVNARSGHFAYESGHHSDLWLDLETLCESPAGLQPFIDELANQLVPFDPAVICGSLVEGAFIALLVAKKMNKRFVYSSRFEPENSPVLFPVRYLIPM